jgi:hypothetical protein
MLSDNRASVHDCVTAAADTSPKYSQRDRQTSQLSAAHRRVTSFGKPARKQSRLVGTPSRSGF